MLKTCIWCRRMLDRQTDRHLSLNMWQSRISACELFTLYGSPLECCSQRLALLQLKSRCFVWVLSVFCHFLNVTTLVINDIMVIVTGNIFSDFCFQIVIVFLTPFLGFGNWNYTKIVQMYPPHSWLADWWTNRQSHPVLLTWSSRVIAIIYHSHWWVGWCTFKC